MKIKSHCIILLVILIIAGTSHVWGQNESSSKVEFSNAPVLFKKDGKFFQQIVARYRSADKGKILLLIDNKEVLNSDLVKGGNQFLLTVPAVKSNKNGTISAIIKNDPIEKYKLTLVPPKVWQIYFVQHSHTDIGYIRPQSEILAEKLRYIDYALDYCDQIDLLPDDA